MELSPLYHLLNDDRGDAINVKIDASLYHRNKEDPRLHCTQWNYLLFTTYYIDNKGSPLPS